MAKNAVPIGLHVLKNNKAKLSKSDIEDRINAENALKVAKDKLKPPTWLDKIAKKEFKYIVHETENIELLTNLDIHSLALYCNIYSQYIKMSKIIEEEGYMVDANKSAEATITSHPLFVRQNQLMEQMRKIQNDLGLNPSSRAKMALSKINNKSVDPIEDRFGVL